MCATHPNLTSRMHPLLGFKCGHACHGSCRTTFDNNVEGIVVLLPIFIAFPCSRFSDCHVSVAPSMINKGACDMGDLLNFLSFGKHLFWEAR